MKNESTSTLRKIFCLLLMFAVSGVWTFGGLPMLSGARQASAAAAPAVPQAPKLSPSFETGLAGVSDETPVGMAIVSFNTTNGLQESHLDILRSVGVVGGQTFPTLGMVAQPMTAGQVRALAARPEVASVWSNDQLTYYMESARTLTGVEKLRIDAGFTRLNGGMPVSGDGDFSVMVIDSGVDATHADLQFGPKVVQNVQTIVGAGTLPGFTPNVSIENVPNTDQSVGHGTHCAGIIGGTGARSGGAYAGVAPGAKIIGAGLGAGLFVLNAIAAWEWGLTNQYRYKIRVVSNSYGSAAAYNPNNPIMRAAELAHDRNITVLFAGANSGPAKGTWNQYAKSPKVIGVAAGSKEGELASFSSRGTPREERLGNADPLDDFDAPTITAPGTGRVFASNAGRFSTDIVSVRATSNLSSNGTTDDAELPASAIPFYTQISGTSMATPFAAGVVALMLDADPTLTPDEIKQILVDTASKMPGRAEWEVGAGYINAYAAVDKVYNRSRSYANFQETSYNAVFSEERPPVQNFNINFNPAATPGTTSSNARPFTVEPGMNVLDVFGRATTNPSTGYTNAVGIILHSPDGTIYSSGIKLPILDSTVRQVIVQNPIPGTWYIEIRGARGLAAVPGVSLPTSGAAAPGPVTGTITQTKFILPVIADILGHQQQAAIEKALKDRVIDIYADGSFRPDQVVTREDLARSLVLNTTLRQSLGPAPKFTDVAGDLARIAEAVTAKGSTLRDYDFTPAGMMSFSGSTFNPTGSVNRLDLAVALIRALGHDAAARSLANTTVTFNGTALSDNAQIPGALRGYVQLAINKGLFEAFPAEVRQIGPGQYQVIPGPRFEPATTVTRATLASKLNSYRQLFTTGG
ncbi:MAG: S8 family serine peptidase [Pyrinomonadaceae bacterium]